MKLVWAGEDADIGRHDDVAAGIVAGWTWVVTTDNFVFSSAGQLISVQQKN